MSLGSIQDNSSVINSVLLELQTEVAQINSILEKIIASELSAKNAALRQQVSTLKGSLFSCQNQEEQEIISKSSSRQPTAVKEAPKAAAPKPEKPKPSAKQDGQKDASSQPAPKEKGKAKEKSKAKEEAAPKDEPPVDVGRLDLRVGKIVDVNLHPDADALYLEKIDVGKEAPLTVVSGLAKHIPLNEMQNRLVVLLCNLKPAKLRGILSEAMVMCASTPEKVELLSPPPNSVPGDLVSVEGFPRNADSVLNPKKKIFETVAPDLKTNSEKLATYKGKLWVVEGKGNITSQTLINVNIK